jgi:hypothetical protein
MTGCTSTVKLVLGSAKGAKLKSAPPTTFTIGEIDKFLTAPADKYAPTFFKSF